MAYILSTRGRAALDNLFAHIVQNNGARSIREQFAVSPESEQILIDRQREEVSFLGEINQFLVRDLIGQVIGLSGEDFIASRTADAALPRQTRYVGTMDGREYRLYDTEFNTHIPWSLIDTWSRFPDFPQRYAAHVARSVALSRISIGWHGTSAAASSNPVTAPNGEDMNVGWLQKLRLERADHVMGRATVTAGGVTTATGAAVPVNVGAGATYKNIDALAYELIGGMPSWARSSTELVVVVSQDLVDEKYFPMINRPLAASVDGGKSTSDEVVRDIIWSAKQIGGRRAAVVPKFPDNTMAITPLHNLSIYSQEESRRRFVRDEPEMKRGMVDYNSVNEGYVIEDTDFMVQAENITFV